MSKHRELLERHRAVLPKWIALNYAEPIALVSGTGRHVTDAEGRTYLDFYGGILTTSIGHNVEEITEAIARQAERLVHSSTLYLIESEIELAERISALAPIEDAKVFFTNSGSEANEAALLLSTASVGSNVVLALRNGYHGRSFATIAATGNRGWSTSSLSPLAVTFLDAGGRPTSQFARLEGRELLDAVRTELIDVFETTLHAPPACLLVEPVQGVGGFVIPPPGVLELTCGLARAEGALIISDEVQTGWWRTGQSCFGFELHGFRPQMLTFAKGLANGLPIGGVIAPSEVMDCLQANSISTFGGNPLSMTAALATLDYIEKYDLAHRVTTAGERLLAGLQPLMSTCEVVAEVRGVGLMVGIEFNRPDGITPDAASTAAAMEAIRDNGVLVGRGGLHANVLRIAPPMSITDEEIDEGVAAIVAAITGLPRRIR